MENRSHALMTGFFTIVMLIAAILAGIWFNRDRVERVPFEIATVQSIPGLNPQAAVRYRGLEVGKVDDILFDKSRAGQILIRLTVDKEAPVTKTTYATLGYQGVTGIAFIQLDDDQTGSPLLASDAAHLARIPLRPGFLDQLEKKGMVILEKAEELTSRFDQLLSPANQKVMLGAFEKVGRTADAYEALPKRLETTVAKAEQSLAAFDQFADNASKMTRNFDRLASSLQGPDGTITKLNATVERVGNSLDGVTSELEMQTLPHLVSMTDEARTSLRAVRRTANTLSDRPQSILFGAPSGTPGPGEPGFVAPTK
jgi:phospholipid/cholesterol/gamma-HCH transport system substrate-binding protein